MGGFSTSLSSAIIRPTGTQLYYRSRTLFGGHEKGGERRNGQRRPAWPGADRCFVNERALAERRMAHTPAHWIRTIVAFRRRSGSGVPRCTVATDLRREKPIHSAGIGSASRSEEHTSELQSLMRISYAVFCLKKKKEQSSNE